MANFGEDFLRCKYCGEANFIQQEILTLDKRVKPRLTKQEVLPVMEAEYRYLCLKCGEDTGL